MAALRSFSFFNQYAGKTNRRVRGTRAASLALFLLASLMADRSRAQEPKERPPSQEETLELFDEFEPEFRGGETGIPGKAFDPLSGFNRWMFHFNDKLYFWALKPTARVYGAVVPQGGRVGISRVFKNLKFPVRLVNSALQGKARGAGRETARFLINSTIGLAGFFDPAKAWWNIDPSDEDFGQTLARYGVGDGIPLILPLIGPTNLRDMFGMVPDYFLDPVSYVDPHDPHLINETRVAIKAGEVINRTSLEFGRYETLKKDALDPYTFIRDAYKQMRDQQIKE